MSDTNNFRSEINLRPGFTASLVHPRDLTLREAERLKAWIDLLVVPEEQPTPKAAQAATNFAPTSLTHPACSEPGKPVEPDGEHQSNASDAPKP